MVRSSLLLAVLVALSSAAAAQNGQTINYYDQENRYSIDYPAAWELEKNEENGTVSLYVPLEEGETVYKQLQISVAQWEEGTLAEFVEATDLQSNLTEFYPGLVVEDLGIERDREAETHSFMMTYSLGEKKAKALCYLEKKEDRIYIIFAAFPQERDDVYEGQFVKVIESLRVW